MSVHNRSLFVLDTYRTWSGLVGSFRYNLPGIIGTTCFRIMRIFVPQNSSIIHMFVPKNGRDSDLFHL